ncbi:MAG: DUF2190 family protein [Nitrospirota bacterium]
MATATILSGVNKSRTLRYKHNAAVAVNDVIVGNGHVLVALGDYAANAEGVYAFRSRASFPKEAALAVTAGDKMYWVAAAGNANKTAAGNTLMGIAVEDAAAADTTVTVELMENK